MAKEEKKIGGLGEITAIRDILFGQQVNQFEEKFNSNDERLAELEKEFDSKLKNLEKEMTNKLTALQSDMNARFDKLENLLGENAEMQNNKLATTSKNDRDLIGKMLQEMGAKLMNGLH